MAIIDMPFFTSLYIPALTCTGGPIVHSVGYVNVATTAIFKISGSSSHSRVRI